MIIYGKLLHDPRFEPEQGWLRIQDERIVERGRGEPPDTDTRPIGSNDHLIVPAFTDAHAHLPQADSIGADGLPLLRWLDTVIFPAEQWWGRGAALSIARAAARRMMREGTVGVAAYLTSHGEINREVADWLAAHTPMRLMLGRVAMDRHAPDELTAEDRERSAMKPAPSPMLAPFNPPSPRYAVSANPRFAVSCSEELLAEIGWRLTELRAHGAAPFIQTHLSESRDELARVAELFPDDPHYAGLYDRLGLLTDRTLLAHCLHLSADEWALIAQRDAIVVHCPTANTFLQSGQFDLDAAEAAGVRIALGSDIAAGPDVAMPRVARAMIETAKHRRMHAAATGRDPAEVRVPAPAEVWELITRRNAELLGWPDAGTLEEGAWADLLVLAIPRTWHDEHLIGRLLYNWRSGLIEHRIYRGKLDHETPNPPADKAKAHHRTHARDTA